MAKKERVVLKAKNLYKRHPSYKKMIVRTLKFLAVEGCISNIYSGTLIRKSMIDFFNLNPDNLSIIKYYFRKAIYNLVQNKDLIQTRESFRISARSKKRLNKKRRVRKAEKVKKTNSENSMKVAKKVKQTKREYISSESKPNKTSKASKTSNTSSGSAYKSHQTTTINSTNSTNLNITNPFAKNLSYNTKYKFHENADQSLITKNKAIWQYYDNNKMITHNRADGWYDYDLSASQIVEEEWQKYLKNRAMCDVRAVRSGEFSYMVDFVSWQQTNIIHYNHTLRKIRRYEENGAVTQNPYIVS